ncbi:MAG: hypothetical protein ABS873_02260 [Alkalibacterium sp.]
MNKNNEVNNSDFKAKEEAKRVSSADKVVAPDYSIPNTSAPNSAPNPPGSMAYGEDSPRANEADDPQAAAQNVKDHTPGNEVEAALNPDEENIEKNRTDK